MSTPAPQAWAQAGEGGARVKCGGDRLVMGGVAVVAWTVLVRLLALPARVPWWDMDASRTALPESTITPSFQLGLDVTVWIAAGAIAVGSVMGRRRLGLLSLFAVLVGAVGVLLHGLVLRPIVSVGGAAGGGDLTSLVRGSAWAAAMVGGWALWQARHVPHTRRVVAIVLLGVVAFLVAKGAHQIFYEQRDLVARFDANPAAVLGSQGIEPGTASARLYERRLRGVAATGWMGMSNAYGSIVGACGVAWLGLMLFGWKKSRSGAVSSGAVGVAGLGVLISAMGLALSGSKGAVGVTAITAMLLVLVFWLVRLRKLVARLGGFLGIGLVTMMIVAVILRGVVGERIGELSLLFRWHYFVGAARVITEHLILGVGPDGFKDAYILVRLPVSPEEVQSPHSLGFDWLATLGLFGAVWLGLWLFWLWRASSGLSEAPAPDAEINTSSSDDTGQANNAAPIWLGIGITVASVGMGAWATWGTMVPTEILLLVVGAMTWVALIIVGVQLTGANASMITPPLSAAAIGIAMHSMIEVTSILPTCAPWAMAIMALACAHGAPERVHDEPPGVRRRRVELWTAGVLCALALVLASVALPSVLRWEGHLRGAAQAVRPLADLRDEIAWFNAAPAAERSDAEQRLREGFARAAAQSGVVMADVQPATATGVLDAVSRKLLPDAISELLEAGRMQPSLHRPEELAAQFEMELAMLAQREGDRELLTQHADRAESILRALTERKPRSAGAWGRLGAFLEARATLEGDADLLHQAASAWERVAQLDPHGLTPLRRLASLHLAQGDRTGAAKWARRALEVDKAHRLDPLKQLRAAQRTELEQLAGDSIGDE